VKSNTLRWLMFFVCVIALFHTGVSPALAATVPSGFVDGAFGGGLSSATAMAFAPDGRLFVLQQTGEVKVIKNGTLLGTNFMSISVDSSGERGLLGIAFDPNFTTNNYIYLYYTVPTGSIHNRIIRVTANGDVVLAGSTLTLVDLDNLTGATNHNGGAMHFRADGKLYVAVGENATSSNSQTLNNRLGKILRYNTDGSIPTDNPFYGTATGANRSIWAMGLRNPYTFAIQSTTDRMFINDVGQGTWEEINDGLAGVNYGWPNTEGATTNTSYKTPYYYYAHSGGSPTGCAITGGAFYNPPMTQFPASYVGKYFFADYCSGWIYYIDPTLAAPTNSNPTAIQTPTNFATGASSPVDLQVGPDGALYYLQRSGVRRITYPAGQVAPSITQHPSNLTVSVGETATFTVSANGTPPLSYQWQKNTVDIPGATSASYTTPATVIGDNGAQFRCVVTNSVSSATSNPATLTVTTRTRPTVNITSPINHTLFNGGQQFNYSGTATDTVDGTLPASAYSWTMVLHHNVHTHPFLGPITNTTSGNFTIPASGHTETDIWYRVNLTVTNTAGLTSSTYIDLDPNLINVTVNSSRPNAGAFTGATITVDGQPFTTSNTFQSVAGVERTIGTSNVQFYNGKWYAFGSWSDSGAINHIVTPTVNTTYTVNLTGRSPGIGIYRNGVFYLRNQFSGGSPDSIFAFGQSGWLPVAGDWNGDGVDSIGVYNPATSLFYLRNSNSAGAADFVFAFGNPNDTPIAGRWDNTMNNSGVGVYRQSNGLIYLKRTLAGGNSDHWMVFGSPGDKPFAGDWDGTGYDSPGILRSSNDRFYMTDQSDGVVNSGYDFTITAGLGSGLPIGGDWSGYTADRAGAFLNGQFWFSNNLNGGFPYVATFGAAGDLPVIGYWITPSEPPPLQKPPILVLPGGGNSSFTNPDAGGSAD